MTANPAASTPPAPARRPSRRILVGPVPIGNDAPVSVQTMVKCKTSDPAAVLAEIRRTANIRVPADLDQRSQNILRDSGLEDPACARATFGADLTRVSVPDDASADALPAIVSESPLPVVADIHFKQKMALRAIDAGVAKIRINPGNIRDPQLIAEIAAGCKEKNIPIRVGVNAGSLPPDLRERYPDDLATALVESAVRSCGYLEDTGFTDIAVSLKANRADLTILAYRQYAQRSEYPLHIGVTEAGLGLAAVVNSLAGIGALLADGIGDTIRVSLTEDPALEVICGRLLVDELQLPPA